MTENRLNLALDLEFGFGGAAGGGAGGWSSAPPRVSPGRGWVRELVLNGRLRSQGGMVDQEK